MLFKDKEHETRWGDMLMRVIRQDPLHRAVYYLIALTELSLEMCYDEEADKIRLEVLTLKGLTEGQKWALELAYDMLNKGKSLKAWSIANYTKEFLPYLVEAVRNSHEYYLLNYAKVLVVDRTSGDGECIEKHRFPELLEALLFASSLFGHLENPNHDVEVWFDGENLTHLAGIKKQDRERHKAQKIQKKNEDEIQKTKNEKLYIELLARTVCMGRPVKLKQDITIIDIR